MTKRAILAVAVAVVPLSARAQSPLGTEFRTHSYTTNLQGSPAIASDASGNFVVVWHSGGQDGDNYGVFARRYDATGAPIGANEFRVNVQTARRQISPAVASDASGRLVVAWTNYTQGSVYDVFARRYDAAGVPQGTEFRVNTYTTNRQEGAAVAVDTAGNFIVVWISLAQDGNSTGIFGQRYDGAGVAQGTEFQVNTHTTDAQADPAVAMDQDGDFVVVWSTAGQDGNGGAVFARRYNASGIAQGGEFRINTYTTSEQSSPAVAMDAGGGFVVAWSSFGQDGASYGVFGKRYSPAGAPLAPEFRVNAYTTGNQFLPTIASDPQGFVIAWTTKYQDGNGYGVSARRYDVSGAPGVEFLVNSYTTDEQVFPAVASDAGGNFVVAWGSVGQDGSGGGVFAQRFAPDLIFEDGFESADLSAWSSAATDGGDLGVSTAAALKFTTAGLQGVVDDTAGLYVQDDSPRDENRYRARFYFATNGFDPGESQLHRRTRIFIVFEENPQRRVAAIVLRRVSGVYSVMGRARLDDNSQADTGFTTVGDGEHWVEIEWIRSRGPDANDGSFQLWVDGNAAGLLPALDNSLSAVDFVRLGALSVKLAASGALHWDEFQSRRVSPIGP